jgi:hypothetical protein
MSTVITNITEFNDPDHWMGFMITISDPAKNITAKIENAHKCCEKWGVYTNRETIREFIGAEYSFIDIRGVRRKKYDEMVSVDIHIHTNRGKLTLHFYNEHNGYYSHDVYIQSEHGHRYITL